MKSSWIFVLMIGFLSGCDYADALLKDGEIIRKEVVLNSFDRIEIETSVQLVLTNNADSVAVLEGLDFLIPRLVLKQKGTVLKIESEGLIGFREKQLPSVIVGVSGLKRITSNFPSKISNLDTLKISNFSVVINGRGTFTECNLLVNAGTISLSAYGSNVGNHIFRGRAEQLTIHAEGLSSVDASELDAEKVQLVQKSVNPLYVNASEVLNVDIFSSGNVYYTGSPETSLTFGESLYDVELGELIHVEE
jgi:hypothetical protein